MTIIYPNDYGPTHRRDVFTRQVPRQVIKWWCFVIILCSVALLILSAITATDASLGFEGLNDFEAEFYHPRLKRLTVSVAIWTPFAFVHLFITCPMWYVAAKRPGVFRQLSNIRRERISLLLSGLGDILLAGVLIALTASQSKFLPKTLGTCSNLAEFNREYEYREFTAATRADELRSKCKQLVCNWWFQILMSTMLIITGLVCMHGYIQRVGIQSRAQIRYENRLKERLAIGACTMDQTCLPQAPKSSAKNELKRDNAIDVYSDSPTSTKLFQEVLGQQQCLSRIVSALCCSDIGTLMVVSYGVKKAMLKVMTTSTMINRSVCMQGYDMNPNMMASSCPCLEREEVNHMPIPPFQTFQTDCDGTPMMTTNLTANERYTMVEIGDSSIHFSPRSERCMSCGTSPMCRLCPRVKITLQPNTVRHLRDCKPTCESCYKQEFCFAPRNKPNENLNGYLLPDTCKSPHGTDHSRVDSLACPYSPPIPGQTSGRFTLHAADVPQVELRICPCCKWKSDEELVSMNEFKAEPSGNTPAYPMRTVVVDNKPRVDGYKVYRIRLSCVHCRQNFSKGDRIWWICWWCNRECIDEFHQKVGDSVTL